MSSSTTNDSDSVNERTASQEEFEVRQTSQGKYFLQIPEVHMATAGVVEGDKVGIEPVNYNGQFALLLTVDPDDGLTRSLRASRTNRPESLLTLPKQLAAGGRIGGEPIRYNSSEGRIIGLVNHEPRVSGVKVFNVSEVLMSRWKSGVYAYHIPDETYEMVDPGDELWFWFDVMGDDFLFVMESDKRNAPGGAVPVSVQHSPNSKTEYKVHLPKQICDSFELGGRFMNWGHDGERIAGLLG